MIDRPTVSTIYFLIYQLLRYYFSNFDGACNYEAKRSVVRSIVVVTIFQITHALIDV